MATSSLGDYFWKGLAASALESQTATQVALQMEPAWIFTPPPGGSGGDGILLDHFTPEAIRPSKWDKLEFGEDPFLNLPKEPLVKEIMKGLRKIEGDEIKTRIKMHLEA